MKKKFVALCMLMFAHNAYTMEHATTSPKPSTFKPAVDQPEKPAGQKIINRPASSDLASAHQLDRNENATSTESTASEKSLDLLDTDSSLDNTVRPVEKTMTQSQVEQIEVAKKEVQKKSNEIIDQAVENTPGMKDAVENMNPEQLATFNKKVQNIKDWTSQQIDHIWELKDSMPSSQEIINSVSAMMQGLTRMLQSLIVITLYGTTVIITAVIALPVILASLPVIIALGIAAWPHQ